MEDPETIEMYLALFFFAFACGGICAFIQDEHPGMGFVTGLLLGPLGIVIALLFNYGSCNVCGTRISDKAVVCPGCHNKRMKVWMKDDKIVWPCRHCGSIVNNDRKHAGRSFPCPICKEQVKVPEQIGGMMTVQKKA